MAVSTISKLVNRIPEFEGSQREALVGRALEGDAGAICELAWILEQGHFVERDLGLALELFQWLKKNERPTFEAECIRMRHLIDPSLPFKQAEVRKLYAWFKEGYLEAYGAMAMAFLTDRAVFKAYNERLCDLIHCKAFQTAMEVDQEEDYRANLWLTMMGLWVEVDGESAMDYQSINEVIETVTPEAPAFIATQLLDWAVKRAPMPEEGLLYQKALDCLRYQRYDETHDFYLGLLGLLRADYKGAYAAFSRQRSERCLLAKAYCLVNGIGVEADQEAARAILDDFRQHPYGLYLMAISLYRGRSGDQVPNEVFRLLDQSAMLGYATASATKVTMQLVDDITDDEKRIAGIKRVFAMGDEIRLSKLVHGFLTWSLMLYGKELREESSLYLLDAVLHEKDSATELSGLGCFSTVLATAMRNGLSSVNEYWVGSLCKFDMSPAMMATCVKQVLALYLFEGWGSNPTLLLDYYSRFNTNDFELAVLHELAAIVRIEPGIPLRDKLLDTFVTRYDSRIGSSLLRALQVMARAMVPDEHRDLIPIRMYLDETSYPDDLLLAELRRFIIELSGLEDEYGTHHNGIRMGLLTSEWYEQFIGYAFFDYNT